NNLLVGLSQGAQRSLGGREAGSVARANGDASAFADEMAGDFQAEALAGSGDDRVESGEFHAGEPTVTYWRRGWPANDFSRKRVASITSGRRSRGGRAGQGSARNSGHSVHTTT